MTPFQNRIKKIVEKYSAREIGNFLRISITTIHRWREGKSSPMKMTEKLILESLDRYEQNNPKPL